MSTEDMELRHLRSNERQACALRDRVRKGKPLLSDPKVIEVAEQLCREATAAVEAYLALRR